jgi:hypothetical protein
MAFSFTKTEESVFDNMRFSHGTFTNSGGGTGGDIRTGLQQVQQVLLQPKGTAVSASHCVVSESLPGHDPVTIVTPADVSGYWFAFGY